MGTGYLPERSISPKSKESVIFSMVREEEMLSEVHRDSRKGISAAPNEAAKLDRRKTFFSQLNTQNNKKAHAARKSRKPKKESLESKAAALKTKIESVNGRDLEVQLQELLLNKNWEQTVILLLASPILYEKYKISDVIRHVIEQKNFMDSMKLIHDLKAISHPVDQLCVSLLIKKLVEEEDFVTAVEFAQEMVPNFGSLSVDTRASKEKDDAINWTPKTLIQAMIRAKQYRKAARYSKQLGMEEVFPCSQLILSMMEAQQWENAVTTIFENRTVADSSLLETLIRKLIEYHQLSLAQKCICKLRVRTLVDELTTLMVCGACAQGDFVFVMSYIRDNKLSPTKKQDAMLLKCFMDSLVKHQEFYKAIKYAIKLDLIDSDNNAGGILEFSGKKYSMEELLRATIDCRQYHVAKKYIKKLGLEDSYRTELSEMELLKENALLEFRELMRMRVKTVTNDPMRSTWKELVGEKVGADIVTKVEEVIISQEEEVFLDKKKIDGGNISPVEVSTLSNIGPDELSQITSGDVNCRDNLEEDTGKAARSTGSDKANSSVHERTLDKKMAPDRANCSWRPPLPNDHEVHAAAGSDPPLDVAALAMQFHQSDPQIPRANPRHSYVNPPANYLPPNIQQPPPMFTPYGRPPPPYLVPMSASQPPRCTFKPSMSYTHCKTISRSKPNAPKS
uniref:Uncharacterized protein AlNc14C2G346 n=1 Tax=Albugo laibachii Nc14 TaxID=890382 RepID=F0VZK8_9STRA|nr:conserved hypothetical protein [Albugo laibachii Nc14]|eukprot:CCA14238.1 conserved hypothetical protein [Albugo laibachii Nc14]